MVVGLRSKCVLEYWASSKVQPRWFRKRKKFISHPFCGYWKIIYVYFYSFSCLMSDLTCLKYIIISSIAERGIEWIVHLAHITGKAERHKKGVVHETHNRNLWNEFETIYLVREKENKNERLIEDKTLKITRDNVALWRNSQSQRNGTQEKHLCDSRIQKIQIETQSDIKKLQRSKVSTYLIKK